MKDKPDLSGRRIAPNDLLHRIHALIITTLVRYMEVFNAMGRRNIVLLYLDTDCFGVDMDEMARYWLKYYCKEIFASNYLLHSHLKSRKCRRSEIPKQIEGFARNH